MAEQGTVSVVIPTYYRNDRLREAIESVYVQEWPVEVIIVDGSGEGHARPVAESFRDRDSTLTYVAQDHDEGPHAARSVGTGYADGEYVQFLDDDDRLLPGKFEAQVPLLSDDVGVVYSGLVDEEWGICEPRPDVRGDVLAQTLEMRTFPAIPSTMLIDRKVIEALHPFEHRHGADDIGMQIELARRTEFAYVDEPLVGRGKPDETISASWAHIEGREHLLDRYADLYERSPDRVRRKAVRQTHYRAGNKRLEEAPWSPLAVASFARAAYHTPEDRPAFLAAAVASLFGRPGLAAAQTLGAPGRGAQSVVPDTLGQRLRSAVPIVEGRDGRRDDEKAEGVGVGGDEASNDGASDGDEVDEAGGKNENDEQENDEQRDGERDLDRALPADRAFRERVADRSDATPTPHAPRHVVFVVVDALRADAVAPEISPFLDGFVDVDAISPSTWTFPAVTSLLSGQYPHRHGATRTTDSFENSVADVTPLPEPTDAALLPDVLAGAGYATYGAFGFVVPFLALEGHFSTHALYDDAPAERVFTDHAEWLAEHRGEPTFSYLHLADLHEPVDPPADYWEVHDVDPGIPGISGWRHEDVIESTPTVRRYRTHRRRLYRAAVEYVDNRLAAHRRHIGDVIGDTATSDGNTTASDDVAYVVTADHGEGFWERATLHAEHFADPRPAYCVGHGGAPYEAIVRVPLGVDGLGIEVSKDRRTSLVDLAPTLADVIGVDLPHPVDGISLSKPLADDRRVLVEGARYGYEKKTVYGDGHKLIVSRGDDVTLALSVPDETAVDLPEPVEASLRKVLPPWPGDDQNEVGDRSVSADVERRLQQLGYR